MTIKSTMGGHKVSRERLLSRADYSHNANIRVAGTRVASSQMVACSLNTHRHQSHVQHVL